MTMSEANQAGRGKRLAESELAKDKLVKSKVLTRNRIIFIWIGILAVIGIVLLVVACETGVITQQEEPGENVPEAESGVGSGETGKNTVENRQEPDTEPVQLDESEKLTVGKPYSVKLVEEGSKNILFLGEDQVNSLCDTIGIVSVDKKNKTVKIIMIPRDTYIEYNDKIKSELERANLLHEPGVLRINYTHHVGSRIKYSGKFKSGSISFLADVIGEKFGIEIHDYVKINPGGFREMVDHLGGVNIKVPYRMDYTDPTQDLVIDIQPGQQHLDGLDAEGFVRFRKGYREDGTFFEIGDAARKKNQLYFLQEMIKQKGTLQNIDKIPGIIEILGNNIQHSIGLGDMLSSYITMATDIITKDYEIVSENLNSDKMIRVDGASYVVLE